MKEHQNRVLLELDELDIKRDKLAVFITGSDVFRSLDQAEQLRLTRQAKAMSEYAKILKERIDAF